MPERHTLDIPPIVVVRTLAIIATAVVLFLIRDVLLILFFAVVVASAITPAIDWMEKERVPRVVAVIVIYLGSVALAVLVLSQAAGALADDLRRVVEAFPRYAEGFLANFRAFQAASLRYYDIAGTLKQTLENFSAQLASATPLSTVTGVLRNLIAAVSLVFVAVYLSLQKDGVEKFLRLITPDRHEAYVIDLWSRSQKRLGKWLQGQAILAVTIFLMAYGGLWILGIKFRFLLALLTGLFEIVPYVGPIISAIPAVLVGILQEPILGLWVIVLYMIIHQIEGHVLAPNIMGRVTGLEPLTVVIALLVAGKLMGVMGLLVAVPLASVLAEFLRDVLDKRRGAAA